MNYLAKFGVDFGVSLPPIERLESLLLELLLLLLSEIWELLDPLGLFDGFLLAHCPYSSETVSEIISCCFITGGSMRLVPSISQRCPLDELYLSLVFSGTSWDSSSFLSALLKVLFPD